MKLGMKDVSLVYAVFSPLGGFDTSKDYYVAAIIEPGTVNDEARITKRALGLSELLLTISTDSDGDGLLDAWEIDYFGDSTTTDGTGDQDTDGFNDYSEFAAGTNPTNSASLLEVTDMEVTDPSGMVIRWDPVSNRIYGVQWTSNLLDGVFHPLETNLHYPVGNYTDRVHGAESQGYYKINVRTE